MTPGFCQLTSLERHAGATSKGLSHGPAAVGKFCLDNRDRSDARRAIVQMYILMSDCGWSFACFSQQRLDAFQHDAAVQHVVAVKRGARESSVLVWSDIDSAVTVTGVRVIYTSR